MSSQTWVRLFGHSLINAQYDLKRCFSKKRLNSIAGLWLWGELIRRTNCLQSIIVLVKAPSIGESLLSITVRKV
jgi:hypothetical protein